MSYLEDKYDNDRHGHKWSLDELESMIKRIFDHEFVDKYETIYDIAGDAISESITIDSLVEGYDELRSLQLQGQNDQLDELDIPNQEKVRILYHSGVLDTLKSKMGECGEISYSQLARILIKLGFLKKTKVKTLDSFLSKLYGNKIDKYGKNTLEHLRNLRLSK